MSPAAINLTNQLARAIGLPRHCTRAVLTLQAGALPTIDLTVLCTDARGAFILEPDPQGIADMAKRIAEVQFMVRLVPFDE